MKAIQIVLYNGIRNEISDVILYNIVYLVCMVLFTLIGRLIQLGLMNLHIFKVHGHDESYIWDHFNSNKCDIMHEINETP